MMADWNPFIFLVAALVDFGAILLAFRWGREWLFGIIVINLVLIATVGGKLVMIFGVTTNIGNVFYAAVFLAMHLILEHYGKWAAFRAVWFGAGLVGLVLFMYVLTAMLAGIPETEPVNQALATLFRFVPRLALASILAFIIAQYLNIWIYDTLHSMSGSRLLWLRDTVANLLGQLVDSALFFSVAFLDVVPLPTLVTLALASFGLKAALGVIGTPFLYLSYRFSPRR